MDPQGDYEESMNLRERWREGEREGNNTGPRDGFEPLIKLHLKLVCV